MKKSIATRAWTWLVRNVRHVWDGGLDRFGISRETVRSDTSIPSLRSSPWILGAPHRGFAAASLPTRAVISAFTGGRPTMGRPEILIQYSRKRRRCQRSTPPGPHPGQPSPEEAIARPQPRPLRRALVHGQLLAQREVLEGELPVAAAEEREEAK